MRFPSGLPLAAEVPVSETLVFCHVDTAGHHVRVLKPEPGRDSFFQGLAVSPGSYLFDDSIQKKIPRIAVRTLRVRLKFRRALNDQRKHLVPRHRLGGAAPARLINVRVRDAAAMPEDHLNRDLPRVWNL